MTNRTKPTAVTAPVAAPPPKPPSKSALVLKLLARAKGATIAEMAEPIGWQPHSTRAFLSGLRKQGRTIIREHRKTGETAYRIVDAASPKTAAAGTASTDAQSPASDSIQANDSVGDASRDGARAEDAAHADTPATTPANA